MSLWKSDPPTELKRFSAGSVTVRVIDQMAGLRPALDRMPFAADLEGIAANVLGGVPDDVLARARAHLAAPSVRHALFAAQALDAGDTGLGLFTSLRTALRLFFGGQEQPDLLHQQRADAAIKILGLAFVVARLAPDPDDRVHLLDRCPAGHDLIRTFTVVELALPFWRTHEDLDVGALLRDQGAAVQRFTRVLGVDALALAQSAVGPLGERFDRELRVVGPQIDDLAASLRAMVPSRLQREGLASGITSLAVDALPLYRYLGARLALESSLVQARLERVPDVDLPELRLAPPEAPTPPPPPVPPSLSGAARPEVDHVDGIAPRTSLDGCFGADDGRWLSFTASGIVAEGLAASLPPCWDQHLAAGQAVGRYRLDGSMLILLGRDEQPVRQQELEEIDGDLQLDGQRWRRGDFDLSGSHLIGTWSDGSGALTFTADGGVRAAHREGTYTMGVARLTIRWSDGEEVLVPLISTLSPDPHQPSTLWLQGRAWSLRRPRAGS
jgi:hypothetical protein